MAVTLPVSSVVNVQVIMSPIAASLRNFGGMLILGNSDVIPVTERIRTYSSAAEIATDFGTAAPEYQAAVAFFSQSPTPRQVQVGRWVESATSAILQGKILSLAEQEMAAFQAITTGTLDLTINGSAVALTSIDLSGESNLNGVASVISTALGAAGTCVWTGNRFLIMSAATGDGVTITVADSGTLADLMGVSAGATTIAGADSETVLEAVNLLLDFNSWYGLFIAATVTDADILAVAAAIESSTTTHIYAVTSQDTDEMDSVQTSSIGYQLAQLGYQRTLVMYSSSTAYAAMSILGRIATVNFQGSNTTITVKFKQAPGVVAENLRLSQSLALRANHVNVFAAYQNDTAILQEGTMANGFFIDEVHGLDWLQNQVETDLWNLLYTSTTKIGQDEAGMNALIATVNQSLEQAVTNGLVAPGIWNADGFGALERGDTLSTGYYVYIQPLAEQSQAEREARKAPPIQVAVKLRGAVHFVDVTITVNR